MADTKLSASHWRLLVAIAWHDRMGVNGAGCYASHKTLGREACVHFTNVSTLVGELAKRGYIDVRRSSKDRRLRVYSLIYRSNPAVQGGSAEDFQVNAAAVVSGEEVEGGSTDKNAEIDGGEKRQVIEINEDSKDNIFRKANNISCKAGKRLRESTARHDEDLSQSDALAGEVKRVEVLVSQRIGRDEFLRLKVNHQELRRGQLADRLEARPKRPRPTFRPSPPPPRSSRHRSPRSLARSSTALRSHRALRRTPKRLTPRSKSSPRPRGGSATSSP